MKTQLLEDIGQSAPLTLTPSKIVAHSKADQEVQDDAPAGNAEPAQSRSALGAWRQKPAGDLLISTTQQPEQQPASLDLDSVFEEIAALEAQYVPPGPQQEPAIAPVAPLHELHTPPAEPTIAPDPTHSATAPQDPLFDFTTPSPELQAAYPFTPAPTRPTRSRQRYLLWGACVLSGALLIQGGRWLYQERKDAGSLASIADEAKEKPPVDKAVKRRAIAAKEFTPVPDGDARVTPPVPASRVLPAVPPLVMLEPDPSTPTALEQTTPSAAGRVEVQTAPQPELVAEQGAAAPLPKPSSRIVREQSDEASMPAAERGERGPVRRLARASAIGTESPTGRDTAMEATLRACREHGYHAAQCIKRACSVTRHGFVCHGR